jgi:hypothetical protein
VGHRREQEGRGEGREGRSRELAGEGPREVVDVDHEARRRDKRPRQEAGQAPAVVHADGPAVREQQEEKDGGQERRGGPAGAAPLERALPWLLLEGAHAHQEDPALVFPASLRDERPRRW